MKTDTPSDEERIRKYVREQNAKSEGLIKEAVDGWYAEGSEDVKFHGKKGGRKPCPEEERYERKV